VIHTHLLLTMARWDHEAVAVALAVIVVLGVGLPVAAWAYTRFRPLPAASSLGTPYDPIDKWLLRQYSLPPADRDRVRTAVFGGRKVGDPDLAPAARGLAHRLLTGRFAGTAYLMVGFNVVMGSATAGAGIASFLTDRQGGRAMGTALIVGGASLALLTVLPLRQTRKMRLTIAAALQANEDRG
jgi:hypothetical protein